jgi:hypothetical protein
MELKDVVSVTGMPGLHKIIGRNKNGLILESLSDKKKFSTTPRQRISILSDIAMFTDEGEVKLAQVLSNLKSLEDGGETLPSSKADNAEITAFMAKVLPTFDRERVYVSDMKKLFTWYGSLKNSDLDFANILNESTEEDGNSENISETSTKSDAKVKKSSAAPKNTAPKKPATGGKTKTTTPRKMGS